MSQPAMNLRELSQRSKMPANQAGIRTVKQFFEANKQAMSSVLPRHVNPERMTSIALTALRNTPKLMDATTESLMGAVMQCSQLGLEPNTVLGHAYLIPFGNRRENRTDVQVIIGYRGLIDLARRSGQVQSISAHAVYENDVFEYAYGLEDTLIHKPTMDEPGEIIAFYAAVKLKDGGHTFEVMSRKKVEQVRDESQGYQMAKRFNNSSPWDNHFEEMGRKTVIRRLFKYLPVSIEMATATAMDEVAERGGNQHMETALEGNYSIVSEDYSANDDYQEPEQEQIQDDKQPDTQPSPADNIDYAMVADAMAKAGSKEALDDATALSDSLPADQKKELRALYKSLAAKLDK